MTEERELDLLVDLARLLRKYGPEPFEALASSLSSPEHSKKLADLLASAARVGRTAGIKRPTSKARQQLESTRRMLESMKEADRTKYSLLFQLYQDLVEGRLLPSLRDIKRFVDDQELPEVRGTSRQRAIAALIRSLSTMTVEEISQKTERLPRLNLDDQGLKGWSDIILGSGQRRIGDA